MYLGKQSLLNRVFLNSKNSSFITLKDGKPNFLNNQKTFQLNRPKTEPGKINKIILDRINTDLLNETKVSHWKNTYPASLYLIKVNNRNT